jgi:hypothetical protein
VTTETARPCCCEVFVREEALCQPPNKQLQRTVIPQHVRAASASLHYVLAARFTRQRAAAQLRYTQLDQLAMYSETAPCTFKSSVRLSGSRRLQPGQAFASWRGYGKSMAVVVGAGARV